MLAKIASEYPGTPICGLWPTRDGWMPWGLFWMLANALPHIEASNRLTAMEATAHAIAVAFGKAENVNPMTEKLLKETYPGEVRGN